MDNSEVIRSMVDDILNDRGAEASEKINGLLSIKVSDALADKKIEIASTLGNQENEEV